MGRQRVAAEVDELVLPSQDAQPAVGGEDPDVAGVEPLAAERARRRRGIVEIDPGAGLAADADFAHHARRDGPVLAVDALHVALPVDEADRARRVDHLAERAAGGRTHLGRAVGDAHVGAQARANLVVQQAGHDAAGQHDHGEVRERCRIRGQHPQEAGDVRRRHHEHVERAGAQRCGDVAVVGERDQPPGTEHAEEP